MTLTERFHLKQGWGPKQQGLGERLPSAQMVMDGVSRAQGEGPISTDGHGWCFQGHSVPHGEKHCVLVFLGSSVTPCCLHVIDLCFIPSDQCLFLLEASNFC